MKCIKIFILLSCLAGNLLAQKTVTLDEAVALALKNNPAIRHAALETERQQILRRTSTELPKTEIMYMRGQYNSIVKNDNNIKVAQTIPFPTVFTSQHALGTAQVRSSELQQRIQENELTYAVKREFMEMYFYEAKAQLLVRQDSLFEGFVRSATARLKTGEGNLLEKTSAETQRSEIQNMIQLNDHNWEIALQKLKTAINEDVTGVIGTLEVLAFRGSPLENAEANPEVKFWQQQVTVAGKQKKAEVAKALPDIKVGYFTQTLIGYQDVGGQETYFGGSKRFQGFEVGLAIPFWFAPHASRVRAASVNREITQQQLELATLTVKGQFNEALQEFNKNKSSLAYYRNSALPNAQLLTRQNVLAFRNGESDYTTFLLNAKTVLTIEEGFLQALYQYNQSIIYLEYLSGNITQ